ncbi:MAG: SLC13/DASS family transporter [Planctomycetes bacterium]|nr:SLC13/DASS family transporter [Planctomycetota bacterium]MBL7040172.1 SLC13/DASS family transporter [Pirellulaceae bacterium]
MNDQTRKDDHRNTSASDSSVRLAKKTKWVDGKKYFWMSVGVALFAIVYFCPSFPDAIDPEQKHFALSHQGKAALALFLLAATWWVFEVVPIGVTSITIGAIQVLFLIRPAKVVIDVAEGVVKKEEIVTGSVLEQLSTAKVAFGDFMDPSVWFILGSITFGMVFSKTGLTKRMAYKMLVVVGERTSMIYLGCFVITAGLTLIMAHTAVAATIYPLLMTVYALYTDDDEPTKFGKGLFIGMAFVAGAGSIITLLGAARGAVAIGFFREIVGRDISFFELTWYMLPVGVVMTIVLWLYCLVVFKPEKSTIPGLRERAKSLYAKLGRITRTEIVALVIILGAIAVMSSRQFVPDWLGQHLHKSAVILSATILFFVFRILTLEDLEKIPWNIILLFGGAMSIGFCLWETGAAEWLAIQWLVLFEGAPWLVFIMGVALFMLVMTNLIMNVAAISIVLPVALVLAPYLGVAPEVILYASLVTAGMPFLLLVGAAPNAIAYESRQFTSGEFFMYGIPASFVLMIVLTFFVWLIWPLMGMPILSQ